jgi:hypothetical protein
MSIDATVPVYPPLVLAFGNVVTVQPSDATKRIEVWRAPDNGSGAPNDAAAVTCATLPPSPLGGVSFVDPLPNDGALRFYKSRHLDDAGNASAFTAYSDGLAPVLITGTTLLEPMAAFGAIVDALTNTRYEIRFASTYLDPDGIDGMQSYIDFTATTNFMRIGHAPVAISSSTNASPIAVTTGTAHGYTTGDAVTIRGHLVNTNANGTWTVTVSSSTVFTLNGSTGNGVGAATGHAVGLELTVAPDGTLTSYGNIVTRSIKVLDTNNAVIMDVESGKRIFGIPIATSVDSGATLTVDLSTGLTNQIRLTNSAAVITLTNPTDGGRYRFWLQQDTTGSRAFPTFLDQFGQNMLMFTNDTPPTLTTTPGAIDIFELEYRKNPRGFYTCMPLQANVLTPAPILESVTGTGLATAGTTINVNMPAGGSSVAVGDLLLVLLDINTSTANTPAGWTLITSVGHGGSSGGLYLFGKVSLTGTEGGTTVAFTTAGATTMAAQCIQVRRWSGVLAQVYAVAATGGSVSANPPPPALTPGPTDRFLWLAVCGSQGAPTISAYPSSFTNGTQQTSGGANSQVASARRFLYASTLTPGTFTLSSSQFWATMTIAISNPF